MVLNWESETIFSTIRGCTQEKGGKELDFITDTRILLPNYVDHKLRCVVGSLHGHSLGVDVDTYIHVDGDH